MTREGWAEHIGFLETARPSCMSIDPECVDASWPQSVVDAYRAGRERGVRRSKEIEQKVKR